MRMPCYQVAVGLLRVRRYTVLLDSPRRSALSGSIMNVCTSSTARINNSYFLGLSCRTSSDVSENVSIYTHVWVRTRTSAT